MKHATFHVKTTRQSDSCSQRKPATSHNGLSITPPNYGVDFVDSESAVAMPLQRSTESLKQAKLTVGPGGNGGFVLEHETAGRISRARGAGQPLEAALQSQMSEAMGSDFSGVRVHTGAESDELNQRLRAKAFTTGRDVFFRRGAYDPASTNGRELIAHELSHVMQQSTGRLRGNGSGMTVRPAGDAFEREADAVARQTAGMSAPGLTTEYSGSGGSPVLQRYLDKTDTDGDPWRVAESGDTALYIEEEEGGQQLFAAPDLVKQANVDLTKAGKNGSFVRLTATDKPLKDDLLKEVSPDVRAVEPRLVTMGPDPGNKKLKEINLGLRADDDGTTSKEFALWADCGRSSRAVMGIEGFGPGPKAYAKIGGAEMESAPSTDPATFTTIYKAAMPEFMKVQANRKFLEKGVHYDKGWENVGWQFWKIRTREIMRTPADHKEAKRMYWNLGEDGRRAFDEQAGINLAADPEIGGAYTLATEYDMPGFMAKSAKTWNFHWAGVVMKDGPNNVTLENYAVSYGTDPDPVENKRLQQMAYDQVNREWGFQMYGTKKKGQTFQEQHLESGTHGTRGSTFAVKG